MDLDQLCANVQNAREDGLSDEEWLMNNFFACLSAALEQAGKDDDIDMPLAVINHFGRYLDIGKAVHFLTSKVTGLEITSEQAFVNGFFTGALAYREWAVNQNIPVDASEVLFLMEQKLKELKIEE